MAFDRLLHDSLTTLDGLDVRPIVLSEEFATVQRPEKQGVLRLANHFLRVGDRGEIRGVVIAAPKIHIINLFFFPEPDRDLPLYAMNFVVLGPRPLAVVLDAVCLVPGMASAAPVAARWRTARERYRHLPQAEDMPDWYRECRSGHDFFIRPADAGALAELSEAHLGLWRDCVAWMAEARPLAPDLAARHRERLQDYKNHHRLNSPGVPLLRRSFGEAWTERYLSQVLFA